MTVKLTSDQDARLTESEIEKLCDSERCTIDMYATPADWEWFDRIIEAQITKLEKLGYHKD